MRKFTITPWFAVACSLAVCRCALGGGTNLPVTFHIVSEQHFVGARFFDAFPFYNLGYISPKPDLVVKHLKSVSVDEPVTQPAAFHNLDGGVRKGTGYVKPRLHFALLDEDAKRLKDLKASGKMLLVMHGERPLTLIRVDEGHAPPAVFKTSLNTFDEALLASVASDLRQLLP